MFRFKTSTFLTFVILVCNLYITTTYANDVKQIYDLYGIEYKVDISDEDVHTINEYENARRYLAQYKNLTKLHKDNTVLSEKITGLHKRLNTLEKQLLDGYNKTDEQLNKLEAEYSDCLHQLQVYIKRKHTAELKLDKYDTTDLPSTDEYTEAIQRRKLAYEATNIGNSISVNYPIKNSSIVITTKDNITTLKSLPKAEVYSIYDGTIKDITEDKVTVSTNGHIEVGYANIDTDLEVGFNVQAGQQIGVTRNQYLSMQLKIRDNVYDISKLFKEYSK